MWLTLPSYVRLGFMEVQLRFVETEQALSARFLLALSRQSPVFRNTLSRLALGVKWTVRPLDLGLPLLVLQL